MHIDYFINKYKLETYLTLDYMYKGFKFGFNNEEKLILIIIYLFINRIIHIL
jgi:hypothetical protein